MKIEHDLKLWNLEESFIDTIENSDESKPRLGLEEKVERLTYKEQDVIPTKFYRSLRTVIDYLILGTKTAVFDFWDK